MSRIFNDVNRFVIDWTINSRCTYHCSYCPDHLHRGQNEIYSKEEDQYIVLNFLNKLHEQVKDKSVHIFLNGGEPTISHNLETILNFCDEKGWCAYVNTNCSRSMEWWQQYAKKAFKVTVSYHPEFVTDDIYEKLEYIGTQTNIGVFTLMYPPLWDKSVDAYNKLYKMPNLTLSTSRVFKRDELAAADSYEYSTEQLQWLEAHSDVRWSAVHFPPRNNNMFGTTYIEENGVTNHVNEIEYVNTRKNTFVGWNCNMGVDHISIDSYGNIRPSSCAQSLIFSNLKDFTTLHSNPVKCITKWCMCTADVLIPKYK